MMALDKRKRAFYFALILLYMCGTPGCLCASFDKSINFVYNHLTAKKFISNIPESEGNRVGLKLPKQMHEWITITRLGTLNNPFSGPLMNTTIHEHALMQMDSYG